jgi:RNA polymerase sigma-70 factor (ECF subfamily)
VKGPVARWEQDCEIEGDVLKSARCATPERLTGEPEARTIAFLGDDASLVAALRARQPAAIAAFHDRFGTHMLRILVRVLGQDSDLEDLHHEVFVRALGSIDTLRDPACLTPWMVKVAVLTARTCLQRRQRNRWLRLFAPVELAEVDGAEYEHDWDALAELRVTYELLERLPADERIVLTLRFIDGMALAELAEACNVSLATAKRRLKRAELRFSALVRAHPVLRHWIEKGGRWSLP